MYTLYMNTLYLDMDGVVADWDKGAELYLGIPRSNKWENDEGRWSHEHWLKLRAHERFFATLPLMAHAQELVDTAREFKHKGWRVLFLTAIPRGNDAPWSFYDKVVWAQLFFPDIPVHFGPYSHDKHLHCKPGDILVDDRLSNILDWQKANGHAIHVTHGDLTPAITELKSILANQGAAPSLERSDTAQKTFPNT